MSNITTLQVEQAVNDYLQTRDVRPFARRLVAAVRANLCAQMRLPDMAALLPDDQRPSFGRRIEALLKMLPVSS
jgi:hypothetical protein